MLMNTALRLLRRLLGPKSTEQIPHQTGIPAILDGATAVALTEALISNSAGLSANAPLQAAELAWRHQQNLDTNSSLGGIAAEGPRGAFAATLGQALTGLRATTFLSGPDLIATQDILQTAVGYHAPLVIHVGLRSLGGAGSALGTGHEALHLAADSGAIILTAANVQEAVDFTLIARQIAEHVLLPVIVAQDAEQTALALQDLKLPSKKLLDNYLGHPEDQITPPTPAQKLLFGERRRRVPSFHNLEQPIMLGATLPQELTGLSQLAANLYLDTATQTLLDQAIREFTVATGQFYKLVSSYRAEDAKIIIVTQGASIEAAESICEQIRTKHHIKVGVLGLRCLRPFPVTAITAFLNRNVQVCVLERVTTPLAENSPLFREIRAAVEAHYPDKIHATLLSVVYGLGGMALPAQDLVALCQKLRSASRTIETTQVYLGIDLTATESPYPKRQVLLDQLRRNYPHVAKMGIHSDEILDLRPTECLTISHYRIIGGSGPGLIPDLAPLLQKILKGGLRCRPGIAASWGNLCKDQIHVAPNPLKDPGDNIPADLALVTANPNLPKLWPIELVKEGALLIVSALPDTALLAQIPTATIKTLSQTKVSLYRLPIPDSLGTIDQDTLIGAICGILINKGKLGITQWRLLAQWEELLGPEAQAGTRTENFKAGQEAVHQIDWPTQAIQPTDTTKAQQDLAPDFSKYAHQNTSPYQSLARFWDQIGVLYANGDTKQLIPEPYLALGAIPSHTATLQDLSPTRTQIPILDATACTGCGACWSACPDGAWQATLLTPAQLLSAGIQAAKVTTLQPLASKVAALIKKYQTAATTDFKTLLEPVFNAMYPQLPFTEERKAAIKQDMHNLFTTAGTIPIVATEALFKATEVQGKETLIALALNPDTCKGCAICAQVCVPKAIRMQWQDAPTLQQVRNQHHQARRILPESTEIAKTRFLERLNTQLDPDMASLGAALLAPGATNVLTGGDGFEAGSGARLAIRWLLSLTEAKQLPVQKAYSQEVQDVQSQIMHTLRALLTDNLPTDDLESLSQRLTTLGTAPIDLSDLLEQAEANATTALDSSRLQRLVAIAKKLNSLAKRLMGTTPDQERISTAMVLSLRDSVSWGLSYPYNPFGGPVTIDRTGDAPLLAAGILDGYLCQTLKDLALIRQARLELEQPEKAANLATSQITLEWSELTASEKSKAGALLLVGDSGLLTGRSLAQLHQLLRMNLPVKILILSNLDLGLAASANLDLPVRAWPDTEAELSLLALTHKHNVYIAQSALGEPKHLLTTIEQILAYPGPALLHLHAPSPIEHGFAADQTLARSKSAISCGVLPLFRYDPQRPGVFGTRFDLENNPDPATKLTPVHWALEEQRFAAMFKPLADTAPNPVPIDAYLAMQHQEQQHHTPFIDSITEPKVRLAIDPKLVQTCINRQAVWQTLQELAGVVTPFTDRVREEITTQTTAAHKAELDAQAATYEARLNSLHDELQEETRHALHKRLLELGGYTINN